MSMTGTPAPVRRRRRARRGRVAVALVTCAVLVTGMVGGAVLAVGSARDQGYLGGPIVVPEEYRTVIREAAARCDAVPVEVLAAQIAAESGWDPEAVSPAGARGIAQFMPAVWKQYGIDANADGKASVWDPVDAIHAAAELNCVNRRLVREASGNRLRNTLAAYNAGFSTVLRYDGVPPYPETEEYVRKILANAESIVL
ncbi:MAG: lytic transglycosylase domain-containing protein [Actinomycetota bacterium]|nr:lytic transglycosylase domain-containing protein [Actinomycetota bacterium]